MYFAETGRLVSGESGFFSCDLRFVRADKSIVWVHVQVAAFPGGPDDDPG